jgi:ribosomal protein S18 acetylase RimI-like enzyme
MITLVSMTAEEARSWLAESERDFASDLAESRGLTQDEAIAQAQGILREILPRNETTTGHVFNWITDDGTHVGRVWFGPSSDDPTVLYIWDLSVDTDRRGQGLGGAALDAVAAIARDKGLASVLLSVFENNSDARRLYERKGFVAGQTEDGQTLMRLNLGQENRS